MAILPTCAPIFHRALVFWTDVHIPNSISALDWVRQASRNLGRPAVAALSFYSSYSESINNAVATLVASGVTTVVAAGNSATDASNLSPASEPSAITVGASTIDDAKADYSNYGPVLDIWAPGTQELMSESPKRSHLFTQGLILSLPGKTAEPKAIPELPWLSLMSPAMLPISLPLTLH